jgi:hypothetical protein
MTNMIKIIIILIILTDCFAGPIKTKMDKDISPKVISNKTPSKSENKEIIKKKYTPKYDDKTDSWIKEIKSTSPGLITKRGKSFLELEIKDGCRVQVLLSDISSGKMDSYGDVVLRQFGGASYDMWNWYSNWKCENSNYKGSGAHSSDGSLIVDVSAGCFKNGVLQPLPPNCKIQYKFRILYKSYIEALTEFQTCKFSFDPDQIGQTFAAAADSYTFSINGKKVDGDAAGVKTGNSKTDESSMTAGWELGATEKDGLSTKFTWNRGYKSTTDNGDGVSSETLGKVYEGSHEIVDLKETRTFLHSISINSKGKTSSQTKIRGQSSAWIRGIGSGICGLIIPTNCNLNPEAFVVNFGHKKEGLDKTFTSSCKNLYESIQLIPMVDEII